MSLAWGCCPSCVNKAFIGMDRCCCRHTIEELAARVASMDNDRDGPDE